MSASSSQPSKETGEFENTLIFYFSDNGAASHVGDMMNSPYYGSKARLWEGGTKTHCIASWPKEIAPGHDHRQRRLGG